MKHILKRIHKLADGELIEINKMIDRELERRLVAAGEIPEFPEGNAVELSQGSRPQSGSSPLQVPHGAAQRRRAA